ncbi:MAG: hypothetical protein Q4C98_08070 [Capnocytophaga sp.]|nr:hypothetical protein [Capnocytophaga sp.]
MKNFFTIVFTAFSLTAFAQADSEIVQIPDANFKKELLENYSINSNNDNEISYKEAQEYKGEINVSSKNISSLEGIEAFVNLTILFCDYNNLTNLDVSKNTALKYLGCSNNQLTSLDVSENIALKGLYCLDNQLTSLDISKNTALINLMCNSNKLTSLNVSKNIALEELSCDNNRLTSLDVSKNIELTSLVCNNNQLTSLDVSKNTALQKLVCENNNLSTLNVANGHNKNLTIWAKNNPNLKCIKIDKGFKAPSHWEKDRTAKYSENCE